MHDDAVPYDTLVQPDRVHRRIYTDPRVFDEEMTRVFGGTWVYLAHESEVPNAGDFRTARLGTRPLIVTRDRDGAVHALFNRCAHRGSTVCQEDAGTATSFQCAYHGWAYASDGSLLSVPFASGYGAGFDRSRYSLGRVSRVDSYRGFIFGTLNDAAPSLPEYLGAARPLLDEFIDRAPGRALRVLPRPYRTLYRGNWKLAWDNAADGLHPTFVHRSFVKLNRERHGEGRSLDQFGRDPDATGMYAQALGNGHMFVDQRPGLQRSFWETQRAVPGRETVAATLQGRLGDGAADALEVAPGAMVNLSIFPNVLIVGNQLQIVEPLSVDRTRLSFHLTVAEGAPDEVNLLRLRIAEDFPTLGNPDDIEIYERCQVGLNVPEVEWVDMSKGLGSPQEQRGADGVLTGAVTFDTGMRGYLEEWRRLMLAGARPPAVAVAR